MAYALGFPKDVTDCIMGMRDFRWEMVRDGGRTPSASCMNYIGGCGDMDKELQLGAEYISICCMPEFELDYKWCVPDSELHPYSGFARSKQAPTTISLLRCVLKQPRFPGEDKEAHWRPGERQWRTVHTWTPGQLVADRARLGGTSASLRCVQLTNTFVV